MPNQEKCLAFFPIGGKNKKKRNRPRKIITPIAGKEKICSVCGRIKLIESFFGKEGNLREYNSCRNCREKYTGENRGKIRESQKRYYEKNKEKLKERARAEYHKKKAEGLANDE